MVVSSKVGDYPSLKLPMDHVTKVENFINSGSVFNWFNYMQSFSGRFVYDMIRKFKITRKHKILDPYVGSGTTLLSSKLLGIDSTGIDINPFCVFVSRVKTNWDIDSRALYRQGERLVDKITPQLSLYAKGRSFNPTRLEPNIDPPEMPNLDRWMAKNVVRKVLVIKEQILSVDDKDIRDFLLLVLASILREVSNVTLALNVTIRTQKKDAPVYELFSEKALRMIKDYKRMLSMAENPGSTTVIRGDSRNIDLKEKFDFVITSPPYPNDIDYVNQSRMELFFLDLVIGKDDFRDLKKGMITSDAIYYVWAKNKSELVEDVPEIMDIVNKLDKAYEKKNWGWDYAKMTAEYFGDMLLSLRSLYDVIKSNGRCIYVVGDSAFKNVHVPADNLIKIIAEKAGFSNCYVEPIRERRASSHKLPLRESLVVFSKN